jgi:O-antigen/teichoic acid export membrane protein
MPEGNGRATGTDNLLAGAPKPLLRATSIVIFVRVLQSSNGFLLSILLVRRFGLAAAGNYALAAVAIATLSIICTFGLPFSFGRSSDRIAEKNTVGTAAIVLLVPASLPSIALYGYVVGRDVPEAVAIALFAVGGCFFAQTNILNALLVLQGRLRLSLFPALFNTVGIVGAAGLAGSLATFAAMLAIPRLIGIAIVCCALPQECVSMRRLWQHLRPGFGLLSSDIFNYGSDQILVVAISYLVDREHLGILGLCRQVIGVADTPGASLLQTLYPALAQGPAAVVATTRRRMFKLAALTAIVCATLTVPLGIWFYHVPQLPLYAITLLVSLPGRYLLSLYETLLKAINEIAVLNQLALLRGMTWVATAMLSVFGLYAVIIGFVVHAWLSAWITMVFVRERLPKGGEARHAA